MAATYYRGAGIGTYWHTRDAEISGLIAASGGATSGPKEIFNHIVNQLVQTSPYISLTRSWEVAESYARYNGYALPSPSVPAYVYEIELDAHMVTLIDPVKELALVLASPFDRLFYQHDGGQDVLLGLVDPLRFGHILSRPIRTPGPATPRGPTISDDLHTVIRALRDSEVFALTFIPHSCITHKHSIA